MSWFSSKTFSARVCRFKTWSLYGPGLICVSGIRKRNVSSYATKIWYRRRCRIRLRYYNGEKVFLALKTEHFLCNADNFIAIVCLYGGRSRKKSHFANPF